MNGLITMRDGRLADLAADVTPELFAELEKPSPRGNPTASCLKCGGGLYFRPGRVNPARLFGCHHPGTCCDARHVAEVRLTIHPKCADKRAAAYVAAGRPWSEIRPAVERAA